MAADSSDFNIGGYEFQLMKSNEVPGYRKFLVEDSEGQPSERGEITRQQTDWSAGQQWWDPIHMEDQVDNFFYSWSFDTYSRPGEFFPLNSVMQNASDVDAITARYPNAHSKVVRTKNNLVCLGDADIENAAYYDVLVWDSSKIGRAHV